MQGRGTVESRREPRHFVGAPRQGEYSQLGGPPPIDLVPQAAVSPLAGGNGRLEFPFIENGSPPCPRPSAARPKAALRVRHADGAQQSQEPGAELGEVDFGTGYYRKLFTSFGVGEDGRIAASELVARLRESGVSDTDPRVTEVWAALRRGSTSTAAPESTSTGSSTCARWAVVSSQSPSEGTS